jgi:POT family proton-dependent oligopeptide transporter
MRKTVTRAAGEAVTAAGKNREAAPQNVHLRTSDDLFGHPTGLTVLAATEMWEVFSFVGMKTLLVYYMIHSLGWAQASASAIYGSYTGFAYFSPIVGAVIADRWLGRRRAVIAGGTVMALGHFMLAFDQLFFPALTMVALGAGLYLPSLPSQIVGLYAERDPRRSWAYNLYYLGMNTGALLAPLVCGTLGEFFGWHWGFAVAGFGMAIGVVTYIAGSRHLPPDDVPVRGRDAPMRLTGSEWERIGLLAIVALLVIIYRCANEQLGNTLALWLESGVDRRLPGGLEIPMTWFQSVNPVLVISMTPILIVFWRRSAERRQPMSDFAKMALGAIMVAGSYALLAAVSQLAAMGGFKVHWSWFLLFVVGLTLGELYILPVALGVFNRLAPPGIAALGAAVWFATASGGNLLAGLVGMSWQAMTPASFFLFLSAIAIVVALPFLLIGRVIDRRHPLSDISSPPNGD